MTETDRETASSPATFTVHAPATGKALADHPVHGPADVARAVERARSAAAGWAALPAARRRDHLLRWKRKLASRLDDLADMITAETGKPRGDAVLEAVVTLEHLTWAARNAGRVLRRRGVRTGLPAAHQRAMLVHRSLGVIGVIGVIGPWNYPLYIPMGSIGYALAAGNAVVFKPSEYTPGTGVLVAGLFDEAVPEQAGLLGVVTGAAPTGEALARSGVDKVAFTGSPGTARKVMAVCARSLTPFLARMRWQGRDRRHRRRGSRSGRRRRRVGGDEQRRPDLRGRRTRLRRAGGARRAVPQGGGAGRGAECRPGARLRVRADDDAGSGGRGQRHADEALAAGGRALLGGSASVTGAYVTPVVLADVPEDAAAMREETFGPTVVINAVADADEAVRRANASPYALGASVFSGDRRAGAAIAGRLRAGAVSVNSVLGFAAVPALPFGGSGDSGFGRIHGAEGLRAFTASQSVTVQRFVPPVNLTSFTAPAAGRARAVSFARWLHRRR